MNPYRTVKLKNSDEFIEKKSRFIATVAPLTTQEEATDFINSIKAEYKDATHNCSAFVLKDGVMRYSDDGEPSGTAGKPMLEVLLKENLVDLAVVVTRYYGDVKLGASGLVRAYTHSVKLGITAALPVTMCPGKRIKIQTDYNTIGKVLYTLENLSLSIDSSDYTDNIELTLVIPAEQLLDFEANLAELSAGKSFIEVLEDCFFAKESD